MTHRQHPEPDSDLRRLLDSAVSDVHPEEGPEQIRALAGRASGRRWVPVSLAAAAATAVVIGAGAWLAQLGPNDPPAAAPAPTQAPADEPADEPGDEPAAEPARTVETTVYYVGDAAAGPRLYPEPRELTDVTGTDLQAAVDAALSSEPADPDYRAALPDGTTAEATADDSLVTLDLSLVPGDYGVTEEEAALSLQALVWTAGAALGDDLPVRFLLDGRPADDLFGVDVSGPVQKAGPDATLAPVLVDSPAQGATVPTTFTVTGRAAAFEANVAWELMRGDEVVRDGFTTAEECCTLAPYSFEVSAPPGEYTLVVHDTDPSDGEGIGTSEDTKDLTIE